MKNDLQGDHGKSSKLTAVIIAACVGGLPTIGLSVSKMIRTGVTAREVITLVISCCISVSLWTLAINFIMKLIKKWRQPKSLAQKQKQRTVSRLLTSVCSLGLGLFFTIIYVDRVKSADATAMDVVGLAIGCIFTLFNAFLIIRTIKDARGERPPEDSDQTQDPQ